MSADGPNILLIVLDTVRAKNLSAYGHDRNTTPFLERFGDDVITYQRAYSPAPWTTPSHASMFTGTYSVTHQTNRTNERLTPDFPTLSELLSTAGYHTVGFSNNAHVSPTFDFDRGFDQFTFNMGSYCEPFDNGVPVSRIRDQTGSGRFLGEAITAIQYVREQDGSLTRTIANWLYRKLSEADLISPYDRGAKTTNRFVDQYLEDAPDDPFFMYLNYMEGHAPYQAPADYQFRYVDDPIVTGWDDDQARYFDQTVPNMEKKLSDLQSQYDGCIKYLDSQIEALVEILESHEVLNDTLIVITSDHGEAFGEHGLYEHKIGTYDELSHVPLWIRPVDRCKKVVDTPVSLRWLFATLLRQADIEVPDYAVDQSLFESTEADIVIESEGLPYNDLMYGDVVHTKYSKPHRAIVDAPSGIKLVQYDDSLELFESGDERKDLSGSRSETVAEMANRLELTLETAIGTARSDIDEHLEVDEKVRSHLAELGYR